MSSTARATSATLSVAGIVVGFLAVVGVVAFLFVRFVFTPTITLQVANDSSGAVQISSCGSDPVLLPVGDTARLTRTRTTRTLRVSYTALCKLAIWAVFQFPQLASKTGTPFRSAGWMRTYPSRPAAGRRRHRGGHARKSRRAAHPMRFRFRAPAQVLAGFPDAARSAVGQYR